MSSFEQAQLQLFQQNFTLILQQVRQWVEVQKQGAVEMEMTLGKVRAFADLAAHIVETADSQLEKQIAITEALMVALAQLQQELHGPPPEG